MTRRYTKLATFGTALITAGILWAVAASAAWNFVVPAVEVKPQNGAFVFSAAAFQDGKAKHFVYKHSRSQWIRFFVVKSTDGFLTLNQETFQHDFAADLPKADADFMALSQVPVSETALSAVVKEAAWKSKPSWYAVATEDKKINPDFERFMAKRAGSVTVEVKGSHAVYVSQPKAIAHLIKMAAAGEHKK